MLTNKNNNRNQEEVQGEYNKLKKDEKKHSI